jgi:GxxExxY protein
MASFDDKFSYEVIGKVMEVHRELGPGLEEVFYHDLLAEKLAAAGIPHQVKPRGRLFHHGILADEFEPDFLVGQELIVELKALWGQFVPENLLQVICYLKFWGLPAGLLFDFGKESLLTKRIPHFERKPATGEVRISPDERAGSADQGALDLVAESLRSVLALHGLGYRDTTYRGLMFAELTHRGIPCIRDPMVPVYGSAGVLGQAKLPCLVLPDCCSLFVTALRDSRQAADRAVLQTYLEHLGLPWGLHVNFGREQLFTQLARRPNSNSG